MPRIAIEYVEVGMQLSKAVVNEAGMNLISKGAVITVQLLQKLVNANIRYVFVVSQSDEARLEQELSALDARFARTGEKPHMRSLKTLIREHLQEFYPC